MIEDYANKLNLKDILDFFISLTNEKLQKISVQEFSNKTKEIPTSSPEVRGIQSKLLLDVNELREQNKYLNNFSNTI